MKRLFNRLSLWFAAGAVGGLANALAVNMYHASTATSVLGIKLTKGQSLDLIYHQIVWGGIWGALFFIPLKYKNWIVKGLVYSLAPTLVQLFIVLPAKGKGLMGLDQSSFTPMQVLLANAVWGVVAVFWLKLAEK